MPTVGRLGMHRVRNRPALTTVGPVAAKMGAAVPSAAKPEAAAAPPTPEPEPDRPAPFPPPGRGGQGRSIAVAQHALDPILEDPAPEPVHRRVNVRASVVAMRRFTGRP